MDDATSGGETVSADTDVDAAATPSSAVASGTYDAAALDAGRYRLTDLIPVRLWTVSVVALGGLAAIAGIQSLYGAVLHGPTTALPASALAALDVAAAGSLASWFASLLLTLAALASVLIYALRRHRVDDYRGTYRIWLWAGAALGWASIDATTRCHEVLRELLPRLTGTPLLGDGTAWWLAIYGLVYGGLAVRMLVEMRRCRSATTMCVLAGTCYAMSASLLLGWPRLDDGLLEAMIHGSLVLLAHGSVLLSVTLYARYVLLDAQGRIPKQAKSKSKSTTRKQPRKAEEDGSASRPKAKRRKATRVDDAHPTAATGRTTRSSAPARRSDLEESVDDASEDDSSERSSQRSARRDGSGASSGSGGSSGNGASNGSSSGSGASSSSGVGVGVAAGLKRTAQPSSDTPRASTAQPATAKAVNSVKPPIEVKRRGVEPTEAYDDDDSGDGDSSDDGGDEGSGLSKAERRRMRKMKRRQQA